MEDNASSGCGGNFTSFILGTLFGAGLVLFYAPITGKKLREMIARKFKELKTRIKKVEEKLEKKEESKSDTTSHKK